MTRGQTPGPAAVIVSVSHIKTLLAALDEAAEYKRDGAATCADCSDQSCAPCQWRLQAANAYDQMAAQIIQASDAIAARQRVPGHTAPASGSPPPSSRG